MPVADIHQGIGFDGSAQTGRMCATSTVVVPRFRASMPFPARPLQDENAASAMRAKNSVASLTEFDIIGRREMH
jgi:hypothetical protein